MPETRRTDGYGLTWHVQYEDAEIEVCALQHAVHVRVQIGAALLARGRQIGEPETKRFVLALAERACAHCRVTTVGEATLYRVFGGVPDVAEYAVAWTITGRPAGREALAGPPRALVAGNVSPACDNVS